MLLMLFLCVMTSAIEVTIGQLEELNALVPEGRRKKVDRQLVRSIIGLKHRMGLGIDWSNQLANELHKPVRRRFDKRTVFTKQVDDIWTADLVDMSSFSRSNKGYKYLFTVIDVFSNCGSQLKTVATTILSFGIYDDWLWERVDVGNLQ